MGGHHRFPPRLPRIASTPACARKVTVRSSSPINALNSLSSLIGVFLFFVRPSAPNTMGDAHA